MIKTKGILCMFLTLIMVFCSVASTNTELKANVVDMQIYADILQSHLKVDDKKASEVKPVWQDTHKVVSNPTEGNVATIEAQEPQMSEEEIALEKLNACIPVIMYHAISDDPSMQSEYCISSSMLESDFVAYKNAGFTPIDMQTYLLMADAYRAAKDAVGDRAEKLYNLQCLLKKYPNPILLTFDDGYKEWYTVLYPLIMKHNVKVNLSLVGYYTDGKNAFLSQQDLQEMTMCDLITFGNHTNMLHEYSNEALQALYESEENRQTIALDLLRCDDIIKANTGRKSAFVSYPYGLNTSLTESIVNDIGTRISLATNISGRLLQLCDSTRVIPRINRVPETTSEAFVAELVNKMKEQNELAYNEGKALAAAAAEERVQSGDTGMRIIHLVKGGNTYKLVGKIDGSSTVLPMQNLKNVCPEITVTYDILKRNYSIRLFDQEVVVDYLNRTVTSNGRIIPIPDYTTALVPVRALFEAAGFTVAYNATDRSTRVTANDTEVEATSEAEDKAEHTVDNAQLSKPIDALSAAKEESDLEERPTGMVEEIVDGTIKESVDGAEMSVIVPEV